MTFIKSRLEFSYLDQLLCSDRAQKIVIEGRRDAAGNSEWVVNVVTPGAVGHEIGPQLEFVILAALRGAELAKVGELALDHVARPPHGVEG
jgi:hypothetical protein